MSKKEVAESRRASRAWWIVGALLVVTLAGLMVATVADFKAGSQVRTTSGDVELSDGVRVYATVLKVLPDEDHMVVELKFEPVGGFKKGERFLAHPVRIEAVGGTDALEITFDEGELMTPVSLDAALGKGDIGDYPFDSYQTVLHVHVLTPDGEAVSSVLHGEALVHGYKVGLVEPLSQPNGSNELTVEIGRAPATLVFAMFVMFLMWALTLLALALAFAEIRGGRQIDVELIALFGVLLFAFPAVRTSVPNAPEVGVLGDFFAYFWCEIALGFGLVALLATTLLRRRE